MSNQVVPYQRTVSVDAFSFSAGTWTASLNGTRKSITKTPAADGQIFVTIPLTLDRPYNQFGARIKEVYIPYLLTVLAPTTGFAMSAFNRHNLDNPTTGAGTAPSQTSISGSYSIAFQSGQNTIDGATLTTGSAGAMIITPTSVVGAWENETSSIIHCEYSAQLSFTPAATTAITLYPAVIRYETTVG